MALKIFFVASRAIFIKKNYGAPRRYVVIWNNSKNPTGCTVILVDAGKILQSARHFGP